MHVATRRIVLVVLGVLTCRISLADNCHASVRQRPIECPISLILNFSRVAALSHHSSASVMNFFECFPVGSSHSAGAWCEVSRMPRNLATPSDGL